MTGVVDGLLDLVFPKRCVTCRSAGAWLCEPCAGRLVPLPAQRCPRCGRPGSAQERDCPECEGRGLAFVRAAAAFCYAGPARDLVTACKFRALRSLAAQMAALAAPAFTPFARGDCPGAGDAADVAAPVVTWVPGHRDRALERGFNQAELFARALAAAAGLRAEDLLMRRRHGARQSGLSRAERSANVRDAFALHPGSERVLDLFKRVVIVDDVYTTGETLDQCAQTLARAGGEPLVFTFARTVRGVPSVPHAGHTLSKECCR